MRIHHQNHWSSGNVSCVTLLSNPLTISVKLPQTKIRYLLGHVFIAPNVTPTVPSALRGTLPLLWQMGPGASQTSPAQIATLTFGDLMSKRSGVCLHRFL